jgi:hypothetical protein
MAASKNYMDLKFAASEALPEGVHFKLIEAVADHICETLFLQDARVLAVTVKIVKLAISRDMASKSASRCGGNGADGACCGSGLPAAPLDAAAAFHAE